MTPGAFISDYIKRWEGGLSVDPNDNGNWFLFGAPAQVRNQGELVGSKYGVTGATLSAYRGVRKITATDMAKLTLEEACDIALKLFYCEPGLDRLAWNRVTASVLDFGWGAGPVTAKKLLQNLLDTTQDGAIGVGGETSRAYAKLLAKGEEFVAGAWWAMREAFYERLTERRPSDGIYLKGWDNRSRYFTPGDVEGWWRKWNV